MKKAEMYHKDLIANVSHDIKTPLTMIKSYAEMIRDLSGNDPVKREKHLDIIIEEADRLNVLVNDMLSLSRLQSHKLALEKSNFDMNDAARDVLASYDILQEQEGYDISFTPSEPLIVEADESKIRQVMNNLMTNAVKYCGEDKKIFVTIERNGKEVEFRVTDHGQGIKPEEIPHVWDRYYQSSTHHVRETSGTGLGLSIVKEILKLHDAKYGVDSTVGEGSSFWFSLPIVR
jgi:signal transduction histidine kinase